MSADRDESNSQQVWPIKIWPEDTSTNDPALYKPLPTGPNRYVQQTSGGVNVVTITGQTSTKQFHSDVSRDAKLVTFPHEDGQTSFLFFESQLPQPNQEKPNQEIQDVKFMVFRAVKLPDQTLGYEKSFGTLTLACDNSSQWSIVDHDDDHYFSQNNVLLRVCELSTAQDSADVNGHKRHSVVIESVRKKDEEEDMRSWGWTVHHLILRQSYDGADDDSRHSLQRRLQHWL